MEDIDRKEDIELTGEGLTLSRRELSVESLGRCQSVGSQSANIAFVLLYKSFGCSSSSPCERSLLRTINCTSTLRR